MARLRGWPTPIRHYLILSQVAARSAMQYRFNFLSTVLGGIAFQGIQLLFIGVLLAKFESIAGWTFSEVGFLFAVRLAAHAAYIVPFQALFGIDIVVQEGEYDRYLLRPASTFVQLITRQFPLMALGDVVLGGISLVIFSRAAPITWTSVTVGYLVLAVIGGGLVEAGIQLALCSLTFVTGTSVSARNFLDGVLTTTSGYPLIMFGRLPFYALTFALPMALIAYLPATALLGRTDEVPVPHWLCWWAPLAGLAIFGLGRAILARASRAYTSPGG